MRFMRCLTIKLAKTSTEVISYQQTFHHHTTKNKQTENQHNEICKDMN